MQTVFVLGWVVFSAVAPVNLTEVIRPVLAAAPREHGWGFFCWPGAFAALPSGAAPSSLRKGARAEHAGGSAAPGPSGTENEPVQR